MVNVNIRMDDTLKEQFQIFAIILVLVCQVFLMYLQKK